VFNVFRPRLHWEIRPADGLDDTILREMNTFRSAFIQLRPEISKEYDFKKFAEFFRKGASAALFRDDAGSIRALFGYRVDQVKVGRTSRRVFWVEYFFVDRGYRGHPLVTLVWLKLCLGLFFRGFASEFAIFGITFPPSYLFGMSHVQPGRRYTTRGEPLAEPEKTLMDFCIREYLGDDFDREQRLTAIRTIPPENPWTVRLKSDQLETLKEYEKMNPYWRTGLGLPTLFYPSFYRFARASVKRSVRRG
jgi:hypothetical protein